jgi:SAM-dependent methyltransferase
MTVETDANQTKSDGADLEIARRLADIEIVAESATLVTDAFFSRVPDEAVAGLLESLDEKHSAEVAQMRPMSRNYKRKLLQFGVGREFPGFEKAGLLSLEVPKDVHSVVGSRQKAGNIVQCDMFVDALARADVSLKPGNRLLDFGASSGRVIRNLAVYYPDVVCEACDPRRETIEWAAANIPTVKFYVSPVMPPLPVPAGYYNAVYAVSVWSHFSKCAALMWFSEMRRVIAPGGVLVFTAHGYASVAHRKTKANPDTKELASILDSLDARLHLFKRYPDEQLGDDLDRDNWGMAYFPKSWLEPTLRTDWDVLLFQQGRLARNQDLYVLRRVPETVRWKRMLGRIMHRLFSR